MAAGAPLGIRERVAAGTTARGRAFLVVGAVAVLVGLAATEQQLVRIGVLVLALPVGGALLLSAARSGLAVTRSLDRPRIGPGESSVLTLTVANGGRLPIAGAVLVQPLTGAVVRAGAPRGSGARRRVGLLRGGERRAATLTLTGTARGTHVLAPAEVSVTDPFGVVRLSRSSVETEGRAERATVLTVTPAVHRLVGRPGGGPAGAAAVGRGRSVGVAGEQDSSVREYQPGDDVRRVHWRSTAHRGELMVRQEEQPWQSRLTVLLDTRAADFAGSGPDSSFEWAVSAAASVVDHAGRLGYDVDLVAETARSAAAGWGLVRPVPGTAGRGTAGRGTPADRARVARQALDRLVDIRTRPRLAGTGIDRIASPGALGPATGGRGSHTIVAVLGSVGPEDLAELAELRAGRSTALAFLVRFADWADRPGPRTGADIAGTRAALAAQGWQTTVVARGDDVPTAWAALNAPARTSPFASRQDHPVAGARQDQPVAGRRQEHTVAGGRQEDPVAGGRQEHPVTGGRR